MEVWKIIFLSKWEICRFHVNLPGSTRFCYANFREIYHTLRMQVVTETPLSRCAWSFPSGGCGFMGFLEELWQVRFTFTTTARNAKMRLGMFGVQSSYKTAISDLESSPEPLPSSLRPRMSPPKYHQKCFQTKTRKHPQLWKLWPPPRSPCCPRLPLFFVDLLPTRSHPWVQRLGWQLKSSNFEASPANEDSISNNPPWWYWKIWELSWSVSPSHHGEKWRLR